MTLTFLLIPHLLAYILFPTYQLTHYLLSYYPTTYYLSTYLSYSPPYLTLLYLTILPLPFLISLTFYQHTYFCLRPNWLQCFQLQLATFGFSLGTLHRDQQEYDQSQHKLTTPFPCLPLPPTPPPVPVPVSALSLTRIYSLAADIAETLILISGVTSKHVGTRLLDFFLLHLYIVQNCCTHRCDFHGYSHNLKVCIPPSSIQYIPQHFLIALLSDSCQGNAANVLSIIDFCGTATGVEL